MKNKIIIFLLVLISFKIYAQTIEYTVTQDCCSTTSYISLEAKIENNYDYSLISKGNVVKISLNEIQDLYGTSDTGYLKDDELISVMEINDNNKGFTLYPLDYLKLKNAISVPGISIDTSKKYQKESMLLLPSYYYDILKANDLTTLYKYEKYWTKEYYDNINNNRYDSWTEIFSPNCIAITNSYIYFWKSDCDQDQYIHKFTGLIVDISKLKNNKYKIDFYTLPSEDYSNGADATFETLNSKQNHYIILEYDGDYINIYLDSEKNKIDTYVISSDNIKSKLIQLTENKKTTISDIRWPRHADGTCDYDNSSTTKKVAAQPSTNVSVNKLMLVTENLKLRSGEATTTSVLTVMAAGTKVKILELGKAETIDGIDSNWVKVEVQKGAKDRDGKKIKVGTVGWCYGGYLQ